jgi:hypothetical protein
MLLVSNSFQGGPNLEVRLGQISEPKNPAESSEPPTNRSPAKFDIGLLQPVHTANYNNNEFRTCASLALPPILATTNYNNNNEFRTCASLALPPILAITTHHG